MKALYHNLKIVDWNFDYARNKRLQIKGLQVMLPCEIADKFPQYFKRIVTEKVEDLKELVEVVTEPVIEDVKDDEEVVLNVEDNELVNSDEEVVFGEEQSLLESFAIDLYEGKVKETKKYFTWNDKKINKNDYKSAEDKEEFLFNIMNV